MCCRRAAEVETPPMNIQPTATELEEEEKNNNNIFDDELLEKKKSGKT